jgi:hypothetical protein
MLLLTIFKEGAGNVFLRLTENCHFQRKRCSLHVEFQMGLMGNDWWQLAAVIISVHDSLQKFIVLLFLLLRVRLLSNQDNAQTFQHYPLNSSSSAIFQMT